MKNTLIIFICILVFCTVKGQDTLRLSKGYKAELLKKKKILSNLIFIDSTKLFSTFLADTSIKRFVKENKNNEIVFSVIFTFYLSNNKLILRKYNFKSDSFKYPFYKYVKDVFVNLKYKEKKHKPKRYNIGVAWQFNQQEKSINIEVYDYTNKVIVELFKTSFPFQIFEDNNG